MMLLLLTVLTLLATVNAEECEDITPVENFQVINRTQESLLISWTISETQKQCVDYLSVCWRKLSSYRKNPESCLNVTSLSEEEYLISELDPCSWYNISVAAAAYSGVNSENVTIEEFTDSESTEPPQNIENIKVTQESNSIVVELERSENETCASHFLICWTSLTSYAEECMFHKALSKYQREDIKYLPTCTRYNVSIAAVTVNGQYSENFTQIYSTGPSGIQNLTAVTLGSDSVSLHWGDPREHDCVSGFHVTYVARRRTQKNFTLDTRDAILTELIPCQFYTFHVTSFNEDYSHSNISIITKMTGPSEPGEVENVTILHSSSHSLHIQWQPPTNRSSCLQKYFVCWAKNDKNIGCKSQSVIPYPKISITGLESCTEYSIEVAALGAVGHKGESVSIRQYTGPEKVKCLVVVQTEPQTVFVSWKAPACAVGYSVCWGAWNDHGNNTCELVTVTYHIVTSLEPATNYTFIVAAIGLEDSRSELEAEVIQIL